MQLQIFRDSSRANSNIDIGLDLRFSYQQRGQTFHGTGRATELSRSGVRFVAESEVPDGVEAELHIQWPLLLQDVASLELVMPGRILRTDSRGTLLKPRDYAFRTCGRQAFHQDGPPERSWSISA